MTPLRRDADVSKDVYEGEEASLNTADSAPLLPNGISTAVSLAYLASPRTVRAYLHAQQPVEAVTVLEVVESDTELTADIDDMPFPEDAELVEESDAQLIENEPEELVDEPTPMPAFLPPLADVWSAGNATVPVRPTSMSEWQVDYDEIPEELRSFDPAGVLRNRGDDDADLLNEDDEDDVAAPARLAASHEVRDFLTRADDGETLGAQTESHDAPLEGFDPTRYLSYTQAVSAGGGEGLAAESEPVDPADSHNPVANVEDVQPVPGVPLADSMHVQPSQSLEDSAKVLAMLQELAALRQQ